VGKVLDGLRPLFDFIVCDSPAGIEASEKEKIIYFIKKYHIYTYFINKYHIYRVELNMPCIFQIKQLL